MIYRIYFAGIYTARVVDKREGDSDIAVLRKQVGSKCRIELVETPTESEVRNAVVFHA